MKKITGIVLAVVLCMGLLNGCGQSYEASDSTVFVRKDGKVVSTDVESFDENTYDEVGLKSYIEDAISAYAEAHGEDSVILKELGVKEGTATLMLEYASAADYAAFNGIELYTGSVASAMAAGYSFDVEFAAVADGNAKACKVSDFVGGDYKVVIIKDNVNVHVDGTVAYVSATNTKWVDKSTIEIGEGLDILGKVSEEEPTESQEESEKKPDKDEQEDSELDMPAIDEDLLDVTEVDAEIIFEFDDEPEPVKLDGAKFSTVYTYIIYK